MAEKSRRARPRQQTFQDSGDKSGVRTIQTIAASGKLQRNARRVVLIIMTGP